MRYPTLPAVYQCGVCGALRAISANPTECPRCGTTVLNARLIRKTSGEGPPATQLREQAGVDPARESVKWRDDLGTSGGWEVKAIDKQVNGDHYKSMKIQPVEFITANGLGFLEGCVIKRMCRWKAKDGVADLKKAIHEIELLIELHGDESL